MSDERGAATLWAVALCGLIGLGILAVGIVGRGVALSHRTAAAADLAALAGASAVLQVQADPCGHAAAIAVRNGAEQISCSVSYPQPGAQVEVVVRSRADAVPWGRFEKRARAGVRPITGAQGE
jgi:secretion/DNA translocation related TadE-like protein